MASKLRIGVDCGGVCRSLNTENLMSVPQSFSTLKQLAKTHELYLISFAGAKRASETRKQFEREYPTLFTKLFFVKDPFYKDAICRYIGADVMIDDRLDILSSISLDVHKIHFTGDPVYDHASTPAGGNLLAGTSWPVTYDLINNLTSKNHEPDETVQLYKYCYFK